MLYAKLCSDGVVDHDDYENLDEIPTSAIRQMTLPVSDAGTDDSVDWKLKYESLKRDVDTAVSPRLSHSSPTHMDWKSMYTSIAEENETLRAKLGRFGLPTECSPEEDYVHLGTQYDIAIHENEILRAQVRACEIDQIAAQSAARETVANEYRLTSLDSTDESLSEQVDGIAIGDTSGSSVVSQDGHMLIDRDVNDERVSLHDTHTRLVSDHATLKESYSELMKKCDGLTGEGQKLERNAGLNDSHEDAEGKELRQEVESLRRQLDAAMEEQQSKDVRYGTLLEEYTALVDSNKMLVEQLKQAEPVRSTVSTEGKTDEAIHVQTSASPVEASDSCDSGEATHVQTSEESDNRDSSSDQHMKQEEGKQQSVRDETESFDDYKALMVTHEVLKEEFQTAQSKAKRDYTKMKAKAVAATRLAEQLKEQLSAAEQASGPASDVSEHLEDYKKRLVVLGDKYQQSQQDVGALKEEQYHHTEDLKSLTEQRDRCVEDIEEHKVTIDSLGQKNVHLQEEVTVATAKMEELEALGQTERASLVEDIEEQKVTIDSLGQQNVNLQGDVAEATARIEELETLTQTERASLVEDIEEQKVTIDSLGQQNVNLQGDVAEATARIEELEALTQTKRASLVEDIEEHKVTIDSLGQQNLDLQEKVTVATARIEVLEALGQTERASLVANIEEQKVTIDSLGQQHDHLQGDVAEATTRIEELEALMQTARASLIEDIEEQKVTIDSLGQKNVHLQEEVTVATAKMEELEALTQTAHASLVEDIEEQKVTIDSLGQQNVHLQGDVAEATARIEELEALTQTERASLVEENSKLKVAVVERQSGDEEAAIERKRYSEIDEEMSRLRVKCEGQEKDMQQLQRARVETENQERQGLESIRTELELTKEELEFATAAMEAKNGELESFQAELESAKEELESTTTELESTKTELESIQAAMESTNVELESTSGELKSTKKELVSTKGELESAQTELESTKTDVQSTMSELECIKTELSSSNAELESTKTDVKSTKQELEMTRTGLESTQAEMEYTKGELESTNGDVESTKVELESTKGEFVSTKGELESTKGELESTKGELEFTKGELESTKGEFASTKGELESTKGELESTKGEMESTKGELEFTKGELESTKGELESTKGELESTKGELESTKGELESTKGEMEATKAELESTQQELESRKQELESANADVASSKVELDSSTVELDSMNARLESTKMKLVKLQEENTAPARVDKNRPTEAAEHLQTSVRTEDGLRDGERHRSVTDTFQQVPAQTENNNLSSGSDEQLAKMTQDLGDITRQCDSVSKENENLRGENESLRSQLIAITDNVEEQVEKMQSAYDTVVEENDNNLVDVKRLTTQLSAAEARCDHLQTQATAEPNETVTDKNRQLSEELICDQGSLLQMEAKYEVLSEEYKVLSAESSSRQKEVHRLEERLRSSADELTEREKEMAVVAEERATEKEWFDLELQDWQCRYDAVHQESRQLKKVLSSGASSDTLATELLGLQHRYEELINERRLLRCAVDEHKTCAVTAETRVLELEARVEHLLLESSQVESSPVSLGDVSVESVRLHVDDRLPLSSSVDCLDLGGVDPGEHSQIGVTSEIRHPSNVPPCFDAFSEFPSRPLSRSVDTGGSSVTTDDVRSDVADSDTSGDNTCDSLTQTCDTVTEKPAGDNSVRGSVCSSQKPRRESEMRNTKNASTSRQTGSMNKHPSENTTGRKAAKGTVKKIITPKVRQPGKAETKRDTYVATEKESLGVKTSMNSSSKVHDVSSLKFDNEKLRREYQKLCEKMKRSTAKAAEDLSKMKRMYENAVKEKKEPKTKTLKPSQNTKKVESVPHRDADSRRLRSDKTCSKEASKLNKDVPRGQLAEACGRDAANRGRDTTLEQRSGTSRGDWALMVCVQCEILLAEKTDLCLKFDSERSQLKDEVEELNVRLSLSQSDDTAMLARKNKALVEQLRSLRSELLRDSEERVNPVAGRHQLEQLSRQLNSVVVVNEALKQEASDLRTQLDAALAATHKSPQRQPGDGSSNATPSNTLLSRMPFVQLPDVSQPSVRSFSDDLGLSAGRRTSDDHQSVSLLSHAELLLQYEILLQEKTELCVRLDEKIAEIETLNEKQTEPFAADDKKRNPIQATPDTGQQLKKGTTESFAQGEAFQMDHVVNEKLTQDVAGLRQELDQALCDRHQLESKLEDLTFKNDELVAILETCESPESKGLSLEPSSTYSGGARLEACEQQWGTLSRDKCALMNELERCKKELIDEQVESNVGRKQHVLTTDVSTQDAELMMSNLLPPEGADDLSVEVGRLTREVEKWRRLNSDLCRVCQCFDDRVVSLSAQLDEMCVINSDLRAENAVLVFEREDWTSGSEDVTEHRGTDTGVETGKDNQRYTKANNIEHGREFGHEERATDFSRLPHTVEQTVVLDGLMQEIGDSAGFVESSHSKVVKKSGDSNCDGVEDIADKSHRESLIGPMIASDDMSPMSRECQQKDEFIKRLEMQLSRQQCDIQRAAVEYKLMISLLSDVTLEQRGPDDDTQRPVDVSVSTCLVDGLTVTSIAGLQHGDAVTTESPGEVVCEESLEEKATFEMTKHDVERLEAEVSRLTAENVSLSDRCREQEAILAQLHHPECISDARDATDEQVMSLVKQCDELRHQVEALKAELRKYVSVEAKFAAERCRCEQLRCKTEQLEQELLQERVALGRHIREQHRLVQSLNQGAEAQEGGTIDKAGDETSSGNSNRDQSHKSRHVRRKDVRWRHAVEGRCGGKVRLKCGCSVEVGGRKMHVHCEYHRAIERLRKALAHTDARRHKCVAPAISPDC